MAEYFLIAKILSAGDKNGFLKIESYTDSPERFNKLKKVYLDFWGDRKMFSLQKVRFKKENIFLKFENFDDDKSTEILLGKEVFVDEDDVWKLPTNSYYIHDIIGCKAKQENVDLGVITDVYSLPSNDVYIISQMNGEELLIPAVNEYIEFVDIEKRLLIIKSGKVLYDDED